MIVDNLSEPSVIPRVLQKGEIQSVRKRDDDRNRLEWSEAGPRVKEGRQPLENSNVKETDAPLESPVGMQPC